VHGAMLHHIDALLISTAPGQCIGNNHAILHRTNVVFPHNGLQPFLGEIPNINVATQKFLIHKAFNNPTNFLV
jgi:hypothetical protein